MTFQLIAPQITPPLDPDFRPAVLANRHFQQTVAASGAGEPLIIALERADGVVSRYGTVVYPAGHPHAADNLPCIERVVKFLLWQRGGWKVTVGGGAAADIADHLRRVYAPAGERAFDDDFMGRTVYEQPFTVASCPIDDVPPANEAGQPLGRNLDGYRIGFDLGASDRKVSAVVNGEAIFSEEVVWQPRQNSDPAYHYREIVAALKSAQEKMPRLDAIGGSSAGIYVNNRPMVASLFRGIPADRFGEIRSMFQRIRDEFGVPLEVVNDGDVTALAGSMSLEDNEVLGVALGSSEAVGYVDAHGHITGWLNELAFAPVDYQPNAPADEWSGDRGVGALYFSQQAVFRLAPKVGIELPADVPDADKLKHVQQFLEAGHEGAAQIWQTIGVYLGYGIAHYADFYHLRHVLILGRVTSGQGGPLILAEAQRVLQTEFPTLAGTVKIQLPDEKSRRVGQSIAAASLPAIRHK
jgi:predicted NBD/HSP70 family sugar kinase